MPNTRTRSDRTHVALVSPPATRPLLKWAGGKRQLLPTLRRHYPEAFDRYIEPFVGSGAVFFDLLSFARLVDRDGTLGDANADLMGWYSAVRDEPEAAIGELARVEWA